MGAGAEDPYAGFNLLMRRKPKENNFKAVLESIRDLMNEVAIMPDWLEKVFLGYGDPAAAMYQNLPNQIQTIDFKVCLCPLTGHRSPPRQTIASHA